MVVNRNRRALRAVLVLLAALMVMVWAAADAAAVNGNPPTPPKAPPAGGSTGSSSGAPVHTTVKTCSLYANPSGFGLACITGGGGNAKTIRQILGKKESLPSCWDTLISDNDLATKYGYTPNPDAPYYVQTCITGLVENRSPASQPNAQINQSVVEIPRGAPACTNYDEAKKKPTPFTADQFGRCVMTLTGVQQQVVDGTASDDAQIPAITIAPQPSSRVRTNEDVAFVDTSATAGGSGTRTPNLKVGGVTLYAVMNRFRIFPTGPDGHGITCNGTERVSSTDTRAAKPGACWWAYTESSANQPGMVYPFRAEADWSVHYIADGVDHTLASFKKYDDIKLPVYDIQTLVIR